MTEQSRNQNLLYTLSVVFFILIVFLPPIYVLSYAFKGGFSFDEKAYSAITLSFKLALFVTLVDLIFGLPAAWILTRRQLRLHMLFDTLIDMPLVVPTAVLGVSVYFFWSSGITSLFGVNGTLLSKGALMIALLHIVFTFPYVVRSIEAAILQIDRTQEQAATMLGASPLTVFRTISLPLFKSGLVSGAILAFTRSLSETGATMMVAGAAATAPILVVGYKKAADFNSAAGVSILLIVSAVLLLVAARLVTDRTRIPTVGVWPKAERKLARDYSRVADALTYLFIAAIILLPTFYIVLSQYAAVNPQTLSALLGDSAIIKSIFISFLIGFIAVAINLVFAVPLSLVISRDIFRLGHLMDVLNDVVLLVPTSALGLSLSLFWGNVHLNEFAVLVLAHISFSFPFMVKPISAALSGVDSSLIDAARSMGATPFRAFKTITYPIIKPAVVAGVIMTFMRSLSETGATLSVSENIKTIPVLLVDLFSSDSLDQKAVLACILLFALSFVFILWLKKLDLNKNARNNS